MNTSPFLQYRDMVMGHYAAASRQRIARLRSRGVSVFEREQ